MWPKLLDMTHEECRRTLRSLELEAYSAAVTAFRAQGDLCPKRKSLLKELQSILSISHERHKAEIRRAVNDEKLTTIATEQQSYDGVRPHDGSGKDVSSEWMIEGRRLVPLMPRLVPQTAFTATADAAANKQNDKNAALPPPVCTAYTRTTQTVTCPPSPSAILSAPSSSSCVSSPPCKLSTDSLLSTAAQLSTVPLHTNSGSTGTTAVPPQSPAASLTAVRSAVSSGLHSPIASSTTSSGLRQPSSSTCRFDGSISVKSAHPLAGATRPRLASASSLGLRSAHPNTPQSPSPGGPSQHQSYSSTAYPHHQQKVVLMSDSQPSASGDLVSQKYGVGPLLSSPAPKSLPNHGQQIVTNTSHGTPYGSRMVRPHTPRNLYVRGSSQSMINPSSVSSSRTGGPSGAPRAATATGGGTRYTYQQQVTVKQPKATLRTPILVPRTQHSSGGGAIYGVNSGSVPGLVSTAVSTPQSRTIITSYSTEGHSPRAVQPMSQPLQTRLTAPGGRGTVALAGTSGSTSGVGGTGKASSITASTSTNTGRYYNIPAPQNTKLVSRTDTRGVVTLGKKALEPVPVVKPSVIVLQPKSKAKSIDSGSVVGGGATAQQSPYVLSKSQANTTLLANKPDAPMKRKIHVLQPAPGGKTIITCNIPTAGRPVGGTKHLIAPAPDGSSTSSSGGGRQHLMRVTTTQPTGSVFTVMPTASASGISASQQSKTPILTDLIHSTQPVLSTNTSSYQTIVVTTPGSGPSSVIAVSAAPTSAIGTTATSRSGGLVTLSCSGVSGLKIVSSSGGIAPHLISTPHKSLISKTASSITVMKPSTTQLEVASTASSSSSAEPQMVIMSGSNNSAHEQVDSGDNSVNPDFLFSALSEAQVNRDPYGVDESSFATHRTTEKHGAGGHSYTEPTSSKSSRSGGAAAPTRIILTQSSSTTTSQSANTSTGGSKIIQLSVATATHQLPNSSHSNAVDSSSVVVEEMAGSTGSTTTVAGAREGNITLDTAKTKETSMADDGVLMSNVLPAISDLDDTLTSSYFPQTDNVVTVAVEQSVIDPTMMKISDFTSQVVEEKTVADMGGGGDGGESSAGALTDVDGSSDSNLPNTPPRLSKRKRRPPQALVDDGTVMHGVPLVSVACTWTRDALQLLSRVARYKGESNVTASVADWFLRPVEQVQAPDYYNVISEPMDFTTIRRKLESGVYECWDEFNADMWLIKANCYTYNPPGHVIRHDCDQLFAFYQREYNLAIRHWQQRQATAQPPLHSSPVAKRAKAELSPR